MKNKDLISIIVPCYNGEKDIERCLTSIINQTYKNLEIIVVDDGSKDNSKNIIKSFTLKDKRIIYLYKNNGGLSSARNYGLDNINGKYVTFIDSDDYVSKYYIEKLYKSIIDNNSKISICDINRKYNNHDSINKMNLDVVDCCLYPAAWNKMYDASLFKNIRYPIGKWYEDLGTTPKITLTNKYSIVNEPLYNYVQNSNSIMHTYGKKIYDIYDVINDLEDYLKKCNKYNENYSKIEFINIYHILIGTVYRASFMKKFSKKDIKKIYLYVNGKYSNWYKNKYIKVNLSFIFKIYLLCLRFNFYFLVFIMLKLFNKKVNL